MSKSSRILLIAAIIVIALAGLWYIRRLHSTPPGNGSLIAEKPWTDVGPKTSPVATAYRPAELLGTITDRRLSEISGIAASLRRDDLWWLHNDGDDIPRIFAVDSNGLVVVTLRVPGAVNEDWEDMAAAPGPDGTPFLYIADIGDNDRERNFVVIYRVKEPDLSQGTDIESTSGVEPFQFRYPDGAHDAEAMVVDGATGRLYVITKAEAGKCQIFRSPLPLKLGESMTFEKVTGPAAAAAAVWRRVTAAAVSPDASRMVVRTYFSAVELVRRNGRDFESMFAAEPQPVTLPLEQQGEAITYSRDGTALVTTSEKIPAPLNIIRRR